MKLIQFFIGYLFTIFISFGIANLLVNQLFWVDGRSHPSLLIICFIASSFAYFITKQNLINATTQVPQLLSKLTEYLFLFVFIVLIYWFLVNSKDYVKEHIILVFVLNFILLFIFNFLFVRILRKFRMDIPYSKTILVGINTFSSQFSESLQKSDWLGFRLASQLSIQEFKNLNINDYITENNIEVIFINWDEFSQTPKIANNLINVAEETGAKFYAISEVYATKLLPSSYNLAETFPFIRLHSYPLDSSLNITLKRIFDVFFALLFFVFAASWLFPLIIIINLIDSGFPIFFSQKRHGIDNKVFDCYKFRSMVQNKDCNDKITVKNDPRITKVGSILRKTSLDELPQFWNVLKGDMSIVGPRPHMVNQNNHYNQIISKYNFRHYVKPGITGLAQVNGFRGEIKEDKDMEDRIQSDLYYIRNWSFGLDISIIYRTVVNMIRGDENAI